VERTPELRGALKVDAYKVTAVGSRASIEVLPADDASAWGLRPFMVIVDELAQWKDTRGPRAFWRALVSALGKVPDARLVVLTSAGDPAHWSFKILEQARASERWRTSEVPGPLPWARAEFLDEQRLMLPPWSYSRLHENVWTAADDRLTSLEDLRACVTLDGPLRPQHYVDYVLSLDLGLKNDRTVAAVCHAEPMAELDWGERPDPGAAVRVVLDRMQVWAGSRANPVRLADVEEWAVQASESFGSLRVVLDPWQAVGLAQRLRDRRIDVSEFTFSSSSVGRLASTLFMLLRNRAIALPDDEALLDELANVRLLETSSGTVRLDHDSGRHDDRAIALALAAVELLSTPPDRKGTAVQYRNLNLKGTR
jgi:hypothetical protein